MNIYYNPEKYNLVTVAEIEYSDHMYQFDTRVVWQDTSTRKLWTMRDSGCSCPTPFEDYSRDNIDRFSYAEIYSEVMSEVNSKWSNTTMSEGQSFLETLRNVMLLSQFCFTY